MALDLPPLPLRYSAQEFQFWWQLMKEAVEAHETKQDELIEGLTEAQAELEAQLAQILAVTKREKRTGSYTRPTSVLTTTENGATATITIANHTRVYSDGEELAITGAAQAGLTANTPYAVYYDDTTLEDTTPTFVFTTVIADAQVGAADGRHFLGVITTPVAASGKSYTGGGTYPPGSNLGGELA